MSLTVDCVYSYDAGTSLYTYTYTVSNGIHSASALQTFGIYPMRYQVSLAAPAHWAAFDRWEDKLDSAVWAVWDNDTTVPPDSSVNVELPESPYCVSPGQVLGGFTIVSHQPPATVTWIAQAYDTLADVEADATSDEIPNASSLFELNVTGTTTGPDILSVTGVDESTAEPALEVWTNNPTSSGRDVQIQYRLPEGTFITAEVYDVAGRRITRLDEGPRSRGVHGVTWHTVHGGSRVASGVYFVRIRTLTGRQVSTRVVIVR